MVSRPFFKPFCQDWADTGEQAAGWQRAIEAFGGDGAEFARYTQWEFAQGLPKNIDLKLIYAGSGTLWTDLKGIVPTFPVKSGN